MHSIGSGEYQLSPNIRGVQIYFSGSDRHVGTGVGWVHATAITTEQWQQAFIGDVAFAGYALTADGVLCLYNQSGAIKFASGVPYLVTALYDTIPDTFGGYVNVDRAVNATNVTTTVPEESTG